MAQQKHCMLAVQIGLRCDIFPVQLTRHRTAICHTDLKQPADVFIHSILADLKLLSLHPLILYNQPSTFCSEDVLQADAENAVHEAEAKVHGQLRLLAEGCS